MDVERFRIGGFTLALSKDDRARFLPVSRDLSGYTETTDIPSSIQVHASIGELPQLDECLYSDDRGHFWSAHRVKGQLAFVSTGVGAHAGVWRVAVGDASASHWQVITSPRPSFIEPGAALPDPLGFPSAELIVLAHLSTRNAGILHACGIVDRGRGYLFCGRSGAGKSTTAGLWQHDATVLNDDRVLVTREGTARFRIHGTPWHGDFPTTDPGSAPLAGVFFLEHASTHRLERVSPVAAHRQLLTSCWLPLWDRERGLPQTIALCGKLARELPCFRLGFRRDEGVRAVVREALASCAAPSLQP